MVGSYNNIKYCRCCNSNKLSPFFFFETPLAGGFLKDKKDFINDKYYPLTLLFCEDCNLVQVKEIIDPNLLFTNYFYSSSSIKTLVDHFKLYSEEIINIYPKKSKILEIGCNDGVLLKQLQGNDYLLVGVDPSDVAKSAEKSLSEVKIYNKFFTSDVTKIINFNHGKFDLITSSNNFAHIDDIKNVVDDVSFLLKNDGTFVIEVHWLGALIKNMQFPFIYHEHMSYWSLHSLNKLLNQYGLEVYKLTNINIHGGSIRFYCGFKGKRPIDLSVLALYTLEVEYGLNNLETFKTFSNNCEKLKDKFWETIKSVGNNKIYGYGSSGQANTFMFYMGIGKDIIPYIIDDSKIKIGCFTPGNHIPIVSSDILNNNPPDYLLLFAYTFSNEIIQKNTNFTGKWIIPLPEIKIL